MEIGCAWTFIDPPQNCLCHQSPAKKMHILEITGKEILYIGYQLRGEKESVLSIKYEISMKKLISDEMIIYYFNWLKKFFFSYYYYF